MIQNGARAVYEEMRVVQILFASVRSEACQGVRDSTKGWGGGWLSNTAGTNILFPPVEMLQQRRLNNRLEAWAGGGAAATRRTELYWGGACYIQYPLHALRGPFASSCRKKAMR